MPLLSRRPALPRAIRAVLQLPSGDRVLAATGLINDRWAVASRDALHLVDAEGHATRHPWSDVDRASLAPETATVTVFWVVGDTETLVLVGAGAPRFARTLRERVQSSVVHTENVTLPNGARVRVALRRADDGGLLSQVIGDGRVDLSDPEVAARIDAAEARVRSAAGLRV
ncbi:MAG: hypothetical protein HGA44_23195 [Cellulomonadaceae bacterium]|nr:hypothetical protein [Cellulomonadaceae bacterium]